MTHGDEVVEVVRLILADEFRMEFDGQGVAEGVQLGGFISVNLPDFEAIVTILENAFADPDAAATAHQRLATPC